MNILLSAKRLSQQVAARLNTFPNIQACRWLATKKDLPANWKALAKEELKGKDPKNLIWVSPEGLSIQPVYTAGNRTVHEEEVPGSYPFTRGPYATMYRMRPWTIRQLSGLATVEETNKHYLRSLEEGQQGLSVAFDVATQRGFDSDNPRVAQDVGQAGVAICSVEDMKTLFHSIPLDKVSVSLGVSGAVLPLLAMYIVAAEEQGTKVESLRGTVQNDILKDFMVRSMYIYPLSASMKIVQDVLTYTARHMPHYNSISVCGSHIQEAGGNAKLELAFTLASGLEYLREGQKAGLLVDEVAPHVSFFFGTGMNFFLEIAKLRAARRLWATLLQTRLGAKKPESLMLRTHSQTASWPLTAPQPHNNIIRTTIQAMAAVMGGTQSLHTTSFDKAISTSTQFSARIARNTQLILREETHIDKVVDPWGGSYMMESLTDDLCAEALQIVEEIERMGGMAKAIATGMPKYLIDEDSARSQARIESGADVLVGVNKYIIKDTRPLETYTVDSAAVVKKQTAKLAQLKLTRDKRRVEEGLRSLKESARQGNRNLVEVAIECAKARATVGEISSALEEVWGRYIPKDSIMKAAIEEHGERVDVQGRIQRTMLKVKEFNAIFGRNPRIYLTKLDSKKPGRGSRIITSGLADLGFDVDIGASFLSPAQVAHIAIDNDVHIVGINHISREHFPLIPQLVAELRKQTRPHILLAIGGVANTEEANELLSLGVDLVFEVNTHLADSANTMLDILMKTHK